MRMLHVYWKKEQEEHLVKVLPLKTELSSVSSVVEGAVLLKSHVSHHLSLHFSLPLPPSGIFFRDEDGDLVILDDIDAYSVLFIQATTRDQPVHVVVVGTPSTTMTTSTTSTATPTTALSTDGHTTPTWLNNMMDKMRQELRQEVLESLRGDRPATASSDRGQLPHNCDICNQQLADTPRFFCLNKCGVVLCARCQSSVGHDQRHVLLYVAGGGDYRGKPKRLLANAQLILCALRSSSSSSSSETSSRRSSHSRHSALSSMLLGTNTVSAPIVATTTAATAAVDDGPAADSFLLQATIERESKAALMNDLGGGIGVYWKQWTLSNSGDLPWKQVTLEVAEVNSDQLKPCAPLATIASLLPGQQTDLMLMMYGPVSSEGVYRCQWRLRSATDGLVFGPQLIFDFTVGDATSGVATSDDSDSFSVVSTIDDADFELVSDMASTLSISPSANISGRSTPNDLTNEAVALVSNEEEDEQQLLTAAASLVNSLELSTVVDHASTVSAVELLDQTMDEEVDTPLLDQSIIIDTSVRNCVEENVAMESTGANSTSEVPTITIVGSSSSSPYVIPERPDVTVNSVLVSAVKVASTAVEKARDVAEKAIREVRQAQRLNKWTPPAPEARWRPTRVDPPWSAPQEVRDITSFDDWTAPQPWVPSAHESNGDLEKMAILVDMGFTNVDFNARILRESDGDMSVAVDKLVLNM